jgi:3-methyladenine DNA glycosylase AlkD
MKLLPVQEDLRQLGDREIAQHSLRFFKTGKGEYGEGDQFIGVRVPMIRRLAKKHRQMEFRKIAVLVRSKIHEERLLGLLILVNQYEQAKNKSKEKQIFDFYCEHFQFINNWDLVDVTCPRIVGKHLMGKSRTPYRRWAKSDHLWTRRIAMISQWWPIRKGDLSMVIPLADLLIKDEHDLIHKAVGWMLREAAKKDFKLIENYLDQKHHLMPRTMLRYAIERFPERKRQKYLLKGP